MLPNGDAELTKCNTGTATMLVSIYGGSAICAVD